MSLIDWPYLFANALWVAGLALLLTVLGRAWWEAGLRQEKLRRLLERPVYQVALNLCGVLFSAGVGLRETRGWAQVLWGMLALAFLGQAYLSRRNIA